MRRFLSYGLVLVVLLAMAPSFAGLALAEEEGIVTLNFWGWGTEWQEYYDYFLEKNPDTNVRLNMVTKSWDEYQTALDVALVNTSGDYPDLFCAEGNFASKYVGTDFSLDLTKINPDIASLVEQAGIAGYTVGVGTDANGTFKGVAAQGCPLVYLYRRSIAKEVLGTDDPTEVYEYVKDIDTYLATARMVKEKTDGKVCLLSSVTDMSRVYYADMTAPFVEDGQLNIQPPMIRYIEDMKTYCDEGLANNTNIFSDAWFKDLKDENERTVMGYVGPPWMFNVHIKNNCGDTYGDWGVTQSPALTFFGGTWLCVGANTDPAKYDAIMEYLNFWVFDTTETGMAQYLADSGDCPASAKTLERLSPGFSLPLAGGQNTMDVYVTALNNMSADLPAVKNWNQYSATGIGCMDKATNAYINGEVGSLEEALQMYVDEMQAVIDCDAPDVAKAVAEYQASKE